MSDASLRGRFAGLALMAALSLALAACDDDEDAKEASGAAQADVEADLPAPAGTRGSVTGMPDDPGDGTISLGGGAPPVAEPVGGPAPGDASVDEAGIATITGGVAPAAPVAGAAGAPATSQPGSPGTDAAAAVVRDYYQALNARQFDRARGLWADGGGASGQSPAQFAGGFADTAAMDVRVIVPDRVDTSTGVAYVDVPVRVTATGRDGSTREYSGRYTLRAEGDAWRIASTALGESPPP